MNESLKSVEILYLYLPSLKDINTSFGFKHAIAYLSDFQLMFYACYNWWDVNSIPKYLEQFAILISEEI